MNIMEIARAALADLVHVHELTDGVVITTHCLYPEGGFVQVVVRGGSDAFVISDEGGAIHEIEHAGLDIKRPDALIRHLVPETCVLHGGIISSPVVTREALPLMIVTVANTSKEVAEYLYTHLSIKRERNFKQYRSRAQPVQRQKRA